MKADLCKLFLQERIELRCQLAIGKGGGKIKTDEARTVQGHGIRDVVFIDQIVLEKIHILCRHGQCNIPWHHNNKGASGSGVCRLLCSGNVDRGLDITSPERDFYRVFSGACNRHQDRGRIAKSVIELDRTCPFR